MLSRFSHAVMILALTACATATSGTPVASKDPNVITRDEIAKSMESNAFEAVARLRPLFLKSRGRTSINAQGDMHATVFVDGQRYGDVSALRNISTNQIQEIRYLNGPDATTKYGIAYGSGAIEIRTR